MGQPAARQGDPVSGIDTHQVVTPAGVTSMVPLPFSGTISSQTVASVTIGGAAAAVVGSVATNQPPHIAPPPTSFVKPPSNRGTVSAGSSNVTIGGKAAARAGDAVKTCNDPADAD